MKLVTFISILLCVHYRANITPQYAKRGKAHSGSRLSTASDAKEYRQNRMRSVGHAVHTEEMVNARMISAGTTKVRVTFMTDAQT
jgi:hypothetical protein